MPGPAFLKRLKAAGGKTEEKPAENAGNEPDFDGQYELIRDHLRMIDSQEVTIDSILNEEYDDWYSGAGEEFYYQDKSGISDMLAGACDFIHTCMDAERYEEGFEIGNQMLSMEILCVSEYGDEEFRLEDMVYHELLQCDLM